MKAKAEKTVSVSVERVIQHPMYGKTIKKKTTFLAHDEEKKCKPGDIVTIKPGPPAEQEEALAGDPRGPGDAENGGAQ